ncbi:hypothetical protein N7495_007871 [Penicillium taxi]|uniref:uncharacterized protein n=1 Tax=Penicillium taxi TaxID=168475 RepID=UPI002544D54D|nr:uncharacterized protein N7495_007871 [Penicillium taxi]KAJ5887830.1 hypothetical protein N7495_007871 [Penicillium taxi]
MDSTSIQFTPKEGRRVLGDKDANACLTPAHRNKQSLSESPVKRTPFTPASSKVLLPSPIFAGQKRTRDQVDEVDVNPGHVQAGVKLESSQSPVNDNNCEHQNQETDAMDVRVSTPPKTEPDQSQQQMDSQGSSAVSPSIQETQTVPEDPDARKIFIRKKAALLRSTLQTAMRNVTNHHIDRRVSNLEDHSRNCPRISFSALSSTSSMRKPATNPFQTPRIGTSGFIISTPFQQTPDLPIRSSSIVDSAERPKAFQHTPRRLGSPMQLSSPTATATRQRTRELEEADTGAEAEMNDDLSPSQRGDAVDGLLKLMKTA